MPVGDAVGDGDVLGATEGVELLEQPPEAIALIAAQIDEPATISFSRRKSRCILIVPFVVWARSPAIRRVP